MASWFGPVRQISYATDDLDAALRFWETHAGVGPWSVFRNLTLAMTFDGRPIAVGCHVALTVHGDQTIELIEATTPGPSPFHDGLNRPIVGLHRLAALSRDIEADTALALSHGMERFVDGRDPSGQRYAYFRSTAAPGVMLELLESSAFLEGFLDQLQARTRHYRPCRARIGPHAVSDQSARRSQTMKAALLDDYGDPGRFRIADVPEPEPGPHDVRIQVAAAAVNPVDVKLRRGYLKDWMPLAFPARIGGDVAGTVEAVGIAVSGVRIGDRVMAMLNPMTNGAYAGKVVCAAAAVVQVPAALELTDAAALPTGALTGTQLIEEAIAPSAGMRGIVLGAGGSTGRAAVLAALDAGVEVYAGVRSTSRHACDDLPVAGVIDLADEAALARAAPFDFVADTVGGPTAEKLFARMTPAGVFASIAVPPPDPPSNSTQRFTSYIVHFDGPRLARFARDLAGRGRQMPIAHRLPLADVARAHEIMERGGVNGKILLIP